MFYTHECVFSGFILSNLGCFMLAWAPWLSQHSQCPDLGWSLEAHTPQHSHTQTQSHFPGSELHLWAGSSIRQEVCRASNLLPSGPAAHWPSHLPGHPFRPQHPGPGSAFPSPLPCDPVQQTPSAVAAGKPNVTFPSSRVKGMRH